jgi:O-antigen ligase
MSRPNRNKVTEASQPTWFICLSAFVITVYFNPSLEDPFNSPKLWLLMLLGSWLLGHVIVRLTINRILITKDQKILVIILIGFLSSLLFAALFTDTYFNAFIGEQQRKLGFFFYFFMSVFMLASALFINTRQVFKVYKTLFLLSVVFICYGFMQKTGSDFVSWDNPYNSIILTLGNPNFASALMSMIAVICLAAYFYVKPFLRFPLFIAGVLQLVLIYMSNSRQGLIAFGIGFSTVGFLYLYTWSRKISIIAFLVSLPLFTLVFLAMLQIGPFVQYVYKASVSIRGYYWRAGIEMIKSNPLLGVGIDSYGSQFKLVREKQYPLTYGFQITSDNAHNVPIQIFSTAGILTGIFYLALVGFILWCSIKSIKSTKSKDRFLVIGIFGAWIAFQSQSIISIDNAGLTIWGWVLGGSLVGMCLGSNKIEGKSEKILNNKNKASELFIKQKIYSFTFILATGLFCSLLYQGEKYLYQLGRYVDYTSQNQSELFISTLNKLDNSILVEPAYRFRAANILFRIGQIDSAETRVEKLLDKNPNSYDYLYGYALINTSKSDWNSVIDARNRISAIDPWNADNYLQLAIAYENINRKNEAVVVYNKILSFAGQTNLGEESRKSLFRLNNP